MKGGGGASASPYGPLLFSIPIFLSIIYKQTYLRNYRKSHAFCYFHFISTSILSSFFLFFFTIITLRFLNTIFVGPLAHIILRHLPPDDMV